MEPEFQWLEAWFNQGYYTADRLVRDEFVHTYKNRIIDYIRMLELARDNGSKQRRIIAQLLDRLRSDHEELRSLLNERDFVRENTPDLGALVSDVVHQLSRQISRVRISVAITSEFPPLRVERSAIRTVLFNVISNAIQATKMTRDPTVEITADCTIGTIEYVRIEVVDNGVGIRKEYARRIYQRGFSTEERGTGMGLFVCANILSTMGGKISHSSSVGKGTTFTILIPIKRNLAEQ